MICISTHSKPCFCHALACSNCDGVISRYPYQTGIPERTDTDYGCTQIFRLGLIPLPFYVKV